MMTLTSGWAAVISRQASMPLLPVMRMSITIASGLNARLLATASGAVLASATTSMLGWRSMSAFRPRRTTSWSSTSMIRCLDIALLYSCGRGDVDAHLKTAALEALGGGQAAALDEAQHAGILGIDLRYPGGDGLGAGVGQQPA